MATPRLSLAQQIAQLEETAPVDFDPEDIQISGVDPEDEINGDPLAAREHYIDVGPSALRKLHDSIADPKYEGVRTTRWKLMEDSDGLESGVEDGPEDDVSEEEQLDEDHEGEGEDEDEDEDVPSQSEQEDESEGQVEPHSKPQDSPAKEPEPVEDLSSTLRKTRDEDRKKGKAVSRQIALWDSLLDARIRLQKAVTATNKLPAPSDIPQFVNSSECHESLNKMLEEAMLLSDELFEFQETLLTTNESISPPPRKKRKFGADDPLPDYESQVRDASQAASTLENTFHPYLLQTLSKWSSKIQAVAPSVLLPSNRNTFSSKSSQHLKSAVQLIDETLADHSKVLARTQIRRGNGARLTFLAPTPTQEELPKDDVDIEMFDDTDFYQQLLRDVIDAQGNGVGGGDDWMVAQRQKKAKKNVDTKASKGRKLRYEVHEKLQNFMVPVPVRDVWHEEQIDELFASLLGKGFENAGADDGSQRDTEAGDRLEAQLGEALKGGFKVFG